MAATLSPLNTFSLPPSAVDGDTRPPEGSPEREAEDIDVITAQMRRSHGVVLSHADIHAAYVAQNRDVVNTIFQLEDQVRDAALTSIAPVVDEPVDDEPVDGTPYPFPNSGASDARMLADALGRMSILTRGAQSLIDSQRWPLRTVDDREALYTVPIGGMITQMMPTNENKSGEIAFTVTEKLASPLHQLVCRFIDDWDRAADPTQPSAPSEFTCPISHAAMRQPVCAGDGHCYERYMIEKAFRCSRLGSAGSVISPMTRETLSDPEQTRLFPCLPMLSLMERWVRERVEVADGGTLEATLKARAATDSAPLAA